MPDYDNPFARRRHAEPQAVIDDPIAQTSRQGEELRRMIAENRMLNAQIEQLRAKVNELLA